VDPVAGALALQEHRLVQIPGARRIDRLERWLKLVARHQPGEIDPELEEVAAWSNASLQDLWVDAEILMQLARISDPQLSPDGHSVAFTVQTVDVASNTRPKQIYVVALDGGAPRRAARSAASPAARNGLESVRRPASDRRGFVAGA